MDNCTLGREDHVWRAARAAVRARDRDTCRLCRRGPATELAAAEIICAELGTLFVPEVTQLPEGLLELWLRWRALPVEVHHLDPVRGRREPGCQHHRSRLVTLCRPCHRLVTAQGPRPGVGDPGTPLDVESPQAA